MLQRMYSVFDNKAGAFLPPFVCNTDGVAVRILADAVNDDGHQFCKHVDDYSLYCCGVWDDAVGLVSPLGEPELVVRARQVLLDSKVPTNGVGEEREEMSDGA